MFGKRKSKQEARRVAEERQRAQQMEDTARQTAAQKATQEVTENANFLAELRESGLSDELGWLEKELGPVVADANVVGNRDEDYEQEIKWGNIGKAMEHVAMRSPGRLRQDEKTLRLGQNVHRRNDRETAEAPFNSAERRAITEAYESAATNYQSLSVEGRGGEMVGETTVTAKREVREEHESAKEKAGGLLD